MSVAIRTIPRRAKGLLRPLWANPVVTRDLRVRLRGSKSVWAQAAYLALLGILALVGYSTAALRQGTGAMSAAEAQSRLQGFYAFIFMALASLMALIAPALTAATITTERQRLTLDLLVTTPLSAAELLIGKLISSVAFIALLLALSLPASALCVVLGGATMGDVFRIYLLLAIDGLVLAAIGLYYSCAVKGSMPALVWTYITVGAFLFFSSAFLPFSMYGGHSGRSVMPPAMVLGVLNPFVAVGSGSGSFGLGTVGVMATPGSITHSGLTVPLWLGAAVAAFFVIRLLVTAAAFRMGSYGSKYLPSLRRQVLFLTFAGALLLLGPGIGMSTMAGIGRFSIVVTMLLILMMAALFLPSLFTPAAAEDAAPGTPVRGCYNIRAAFGPEHAGALPYFHLWLLTLAAALAVVFWWSGRVRWEDLGVFAALLLYLSSLGFLVWCIARRSASVVRGLSGARALAFGAMVVVATAPLALMAFSFEHSGPDESPLRILWVLRPLVEYRLHAPGDYAAVFIQTAALAYALGMLFYPFWKPVIPGGKRPET